VARADGVSVSEAVRAAIADADGRRVTARRALTLDAARHFGARGGVPTARTSC